MYRRELLGDLVRLAYETIHELMSKAAGDHKARPGVVAVPQTFGSVLNVHPHAHCLAAHFSQAVTIATCNSQTLVL